MQRRFIRIAVALAAAGALAAMAPPSDPVAVYAVVDRVVFAPDSARPATVEIWGTFAVSEHKPGDNYLPAVKGYMYYRVDPSNDRASRAEWSDLRSVAGSKAIVGFGAKWISGSLGRVRCATEKPANPDMYPTQNSMGVAKAAHQRNTGWPIAKSLLSAKVADAPCSKAD